MPSTPAIPPLLPPAAMLYGPETVRNGALGRFAAALRSRGWTVGGLLQEELRRPDGEKLGIDAVDIDGGRRIPIVRYSDVHLRDRICGLDTALLTEATAILRRATEDRVDLLVVEKFGAREKEGGGLSDEILQAMAEGIPTLVAVSLEAFDRWNAVTAGMGVLLPMEEQALWRWWGPHRLYRDLLLGLAAGAARRVVAGRRFTLVEGPDGCGLARTPDSGPVADTGALEGLPLTEIAGRVTSWDPAEAALGLAAINAAYNRFDLDAPDRNGLDLVSADACVVGRFPGIGERSRDWPVIEREPRAGEYPPEAAAWLFPTREWAVITASTLIDHALPAFIAARGNARIALVGPSTPLCPRLHAYGVETLSGFVVEDVAGCAEAVIRGAGFRDLRRYGRLATLQGP